MKYISQDNRDCGAGDCVQQNLHAHLQNIVTVDVPGRVRAAAKFALEAIVLGKHRNRKDNHIHRKYSRGKERTSSVKRGCVLDTAWSLNCFVFVHPSVYTRALHTLRIHSVGYFTPQKCHEQLALASENEKQSFPMKSSGGWSP